MSECQQADPPRALCEVPNLDAVPPEDLPAHRARFRQLTQACNDQLLASMAPGTAPADPLFIGLSQLELMRHRRCLARLGAYCSLRYEATLLRLQGEIDDALTVERCMDDLYQKLPAEYRW